MIMQKRTLSLSFLAAAIAGVAILASDPVRADWPQFLGPSRNGHSDGVKLASSWPPTGPKKLWEVKVGMAFSAPVVVGDSVIVLYRQGDEEIVDCLDAANGKRRWHDSLPTAYRDSFGFNNGPWSTPTVQGDLVFTLGAGGSLRCLKFATGKRVWSVDTHKEFQVEPGFFGDSCSPLVEGKLVLLNVGGKQAGIVAFHIGDGKVAWKATDHDASYSSPVSATIAGKRRVVFFTRRGLVVLDPESGDVKADVYWRARIRSSVNAATPIVQGDRVFISTEYGVGATLLDLTKKEPATLWESDDALTNHYATSVYHQGYLYGFHGRQEQGTELRCVGFEKGDVRWKERLSGSGTVLVSGEMLVILTEKGELTLARATPEKFEKLAQAKILDQTIRAYPALAGGKLYARNQSKLICVDLSSMSSEAGAR